MNITLDREDYSVPEAARALGVSASTVWRWIDGKRLPAYRVGLRKIRVKRDDLAAMIEPARTEDCPEKEIQPVYRVEWTPEVRAQQRELVARILADQKGRSIAPLTTADLIRQVREEREERYASWTSSGSRRVGGSEVASSGRGES